MPEAPYIHHTAVVDEGAILEDGVKIWHFCHVMTSTRLGKGTSLGQNTFVASGVTMGSNCKIQNNVSLYQGVTLGDDVFLGPSCVFTNVINPRSKIVRVDAYLPTHIADGASVGANATILCGITVGKYAFIGAGAVVLRSVPDFAIMVGNPAVQNGWMSPYGFRLSFENARKVEEGDNILNVAVCEESGETFSLKVDSEGREFVEQIS